MSLSIKKYKVFEIKDNINLPLCDENGEISSTMDNAGIGDLIICDDTGCYIKHWVDNEMDYYAKLYVKESFFESNPNIFHKH